jgi:hemerythrin-like domain-containing protein
MKPTEILTQEHVLIRLMLDNLSVAVHRMELGGRPAREFFEKAIEFGQSFVHRYHHYKEEYVMFTRLAEKKQGALDQSVKALRSDHERALNLLAEIGRSLPGYEAGGEQEAGIIVSNLAGYVALLLRHIYREDHVLFPMVEKDLSEPELADLVKVFKQVADKFGGHSFETFEQVVLELRTFL